MRSLIIASSLAIIFSIGSANAMEFPGERPGGPPGCAPGLVGQGFVCNDGEGNLIDFPENDFQGPRGPQGPEGPRGPEGPQGEPDEQGEQVTENEEDISENRDNIQVNQREISSNREGVERNRERVVDNRRRIDDLNDKVGFLDSRLSAAVASAIAMGQHQYDTDYDGLQMSLGAGAYRSEEAISLGFGGQIANDVFLNGSISTNSRDDEAVGLGVTWRF